MLLLRYSADEEKVCNDDKVEPKRRISRWKSDIHSPARRFSHPCKLGQAPLTFLSREGKNVPMTLRGFENAASARNRETSETALQGFDAPSALIGRWTFWGGGNSP